MRASPVPDSLSRARERAGVRVRELRSNATEAERTLWQRLRNRQLGGWKFRRQHPVGPYFADFACIEGFTVLRFDNHQALAETDAVLTAILQWLQTQPTALTPTLSRRRERE